MKQRMENRRCVGNELSASRGAVSEGEIALEHPGAKAEERRPAEPSESRVLTLLSLNGSSWGTFRDWITSDRCDADIAFGQETRLIGGRTAEASSAMCGQGWHVFFAPALATGTAHMAASGGVCIAFRSHLAAWAPTGEMKAEDATLVPGRVAVAMVKTHGYGTVALYSIYLVVGEGLAPGTLNHSICQQTADHIRGHGLPWIAAGDLNATEAEVAASPLCTATGGAIAADKGTTCKSQRTGKHSCIDMFVLDKRLVRGASAAKADREAGINPHSPVTLKLAAASKVEQVQVLARQRLPTCRPVGPSPPPPDWSETLANLRAATDQWTQGGVTLKGAERQQGQKALNDMYEQWLPLARVELAGVLQIEAKDAAKAGGELQLKQAPLHQALHKKGTQRDTPSLAFTWAVGIVEEAMALTKPGTRGLKQWDKAMRLADLGLKLAAKKHGQDLFRKHLAQDKAEVWIELLGDFGRVALLTVLRWTQAPSTESSVKSLLDFAAALAEPLLKELVAQQRAFTQTEWRRGEGGWTQWAKAAVQERGGARGFVWVREPFG